jgi:hypothetical protein
MGFNAVPSPDLFIDGSPAGSVCCVWEDSLSRQYILSAAHVVAGLPSGTPIVWIGGNALQGDGLTLGPELYWMATDGGELDAGPVSIRTAGPFSTTAAYPWAQQVMSWTTVDSVRSVIVCGKFGQRFATFDCKLPPGEVIGRHVYGRLLRFKFDNSTTHPGDSGAPIISLPEGMLIGMHVDLRTDFDGQFSLAVAAADIAEAYAFPLPGFKLRP